MSVKQTQMRDDIPWNLQKVWQGGVVAYLVRTEYLHENKHSLSHYSLVSLLLFWAPGRALLRVDD